MEKIKWTIIGIIIYLGGGWVAKKITFSMIEITGDMTLSDIAHYENLSYSSIPLIISTISSIIENNDGKLCISLLLCLVANLCIGVMPFSMTAVILFNIVNIGIIVWITYTNKKINKKLNS